MRSAHKAAASVAAVAIVTAGSFAAGHQAASPSTAVCHYQADGALPDPSCTPGATNPDVTDTPAVLKRTICKSGWTKTIRPSVSVTNALKTQQMALYGAPPPRSLYEEDHLISLQLAAKTPSRPP